jgi:hypothetical protein
MSVYLDEVKGISYQIKGFNCINPTIGLYDLESAEFYP